MYECCVRKALANRKPKTRFSTKLSTVVALHGRSTLRALVYYIQTSNERAKTGSGEIIFPWYRGKMHLRRAQCGRARRNLKNDVTHRLLEVWWDIGGKDRYSRVSQLLRVICTLLRVFIVHIVRPQKMISAFRVYLHPFWWCLQIYQHS